MAAKMPRPGATCNACAAAPMRTKPRRAEIRERDQVMRILTSALAGIALLFTTACQGGAKAPVAATGDMIMGKADAPITLIEYASPTCPVCKQFHDEELPKIKTAYIDNGKAKLIFREMPSHNPPVDVAIFLLARCAGADKYFAVIDDAYARAAQIEQASASATGARPFLIEMGQKFGLSADGAQACISDTKGMKRILEGAEAGGRDYKVQGTPTIIVEGETLDGFTAVQVGAKIDEKLKAKGK
jgi:protein-disulfide isomerase